MPAKKGQPSAGRVESVSKNRGNNGKRLQKQASNAKKHSLRSEMNIVRNDNTKRSAGSVCDQHKLEVTSAVNDNPKKASTPASPTNVMNLKDVSIEEASDRLRAKIAKICDPQSAILSGELQSCFAQFSLEAIQTVLSEIDLEKADLASIIAATRALEQFANAHPQNAPAIVELGGIQILVNVISGCKDERLHEAACASLMAMILKYSQCRNSVIAAGGIQAAIHVMKSHLASSSLQIVGCRMLKELAANNPGAQDLIATASGVEIVLESMAQHSSIGILQAVGCGVLRNMSAGNSAHQSHIASLGGVQQVLHSMVQNTGDATVQWAGCWAIFCLSVRNNEVQAEFRRHGAVDVVLGSMRQHRSIPKLQEAGCWALSELSAAGDVKMDLVVRSQALSRAMADHPLNEQVTKAGRAALARLRSYDRKPTLAAPSNKKRRIASLPTIHE